MLRVDKRAMIMLVGEDAGRDENVTKALATIKPTKVFRALSTQRVLETLNRNPAIRLILVSDLAYADLHYWVPFVKTLYPRVKVVVLATDETQRSTGADGWLPSSHTRASVRHLLNTLLAA
jgi:hypothetical protein